MSLYRYSGRNKLANWLSTCLYIDLIICGFLLYLNFTVVYDYIRAHPLETVIIAVVFIVYIAIIDTVKQKILKSRDDARTSLAEIFASLYLFFHGIFYILLTGYLLSGIYQGMTGVQISSDFLLSWSIILGALVLIAFYLKNKEYPQSLVSDGEGGHTDPRWDYPDGHLSSEDHYPEENSGDSYQVRYPTDSLSGYRRSSEDLTCFVCGKRDMLPMKGRDGHYYCQNHILPENRILSPDSGQAAFIHLQKPDTRCKNPYCRREIYHTDIIKCGPCGNLFCKHCWEAHRWSHGKAPAIGISYTADGTFSGFDGTEQMKK
jgi:hypothetical protein